MNEFVDHTSWKQSEARLTEQSLPEVAKTPGSVVLPETV